MIFLAIRTLFYADGTTVYQAPDFMALADCLSTDGVYKSSDLVVTANNPADLSVVVATGRCKISINNSGYVVLSDTAVKIPLTANTSGYNRIDTVVIEVNPVTYHTSFKAVQGTPSSSPVAPVITATQKPLANILVGNNVSVINSNVITDKRFVAGPELLGQPNGPASLDPYGHVPKWQIDRTRILNVHPTGYDIDGWCLFDTFAILDISYAYISGLPSYIQHGISQKYFPRISVGICGTDYNTKTLVNGTFWADGTFSFYDSSGAALPEAVIRCAPIIYEIKGD